MNAAVLDLPRPLMLGTMSVPDLWAALQEADREEQRFMDQQDSVPLSSPRYAAASARLDFTRERQEAIVTELRNRAAAFTGGVDIHELAGRLL